jgi:hypothetical protein
MEPIEDLDVLDEERVRQREATMPESFTFIWQP